MLGVGDEVSLGVRWGAMGDGVAVDWMCWCWYTALSVLRYPNVLPGHVCMGTTETSDLGCRPTERSQFEMHIQLSAYPCSGTTS